MLFLGLIRHVGSGNVALGRVCNATPLLLFGTFGHIHFIGVFDCNPLRTTCHSSFFLHSSFSLIREVLGTQTVSLEIAKHALASTLVGVIWRHGSYYNWFLGADQCSCITVSSPTAYHTKSITYLCDVKQTGCAAGSRQGRSRLPRASNILRM